MPLVNRWVAGAGSVSQSVMSCLTRNRQGRQRVRPQHRRHQERPRRLSLARPKGRYRDTALMEVRNQDAIEIVFRQLVASST